jgi:hypothetical protein
MRSPPDADGAGRSESTSKGSGVFARLASTLRPLLRPALLGAFCAPLLGGCCSYFYYDCAPQQPAPITARENITTFVSARDSTEGLLIAANDVLSSGAIAQITPQYTNAANAANHFLDYAQTALRSGSTDAAEADRRIDDAVTAVDAFANAVQGAASNPSNFKTPFRPLPPDAVLDDLTAEPPLIAAAEQVKNGVGAGAGAVRVVRGVIPALPQQERDWIAQSIGSTRWRPATELLSGPTLAGRSRRDD